MITSANGQERPPLHLLASESDLVASLALQSEHRQPVVAAMLLEEIERAELHDSETMPPGHAALNSYVTFVDGKAQQLREVKLVLPAEANIALGRVSILTPMGAALYGLAAGHSIEWPDLQGNYRPIQIVRVVQPEDRTSSGSEQASTLRADALAPPPRSPGVRSCAPDGETSESAQSWMNTLSSK